MGCCLWGRTVGHDLAAAETYYLEDLVLHQLDPKEIQLDQSIYDITR